MAVNPVTNKIYVANNSSASVSVIDGAVNTVKTVATGASPFAEAVNPVTDKIYIANNAGSSENVTVIDGLTNSTLTIPSGITPYSLAVNPATNQIYVAVENSNNVMVIDGATNTAVIVAAGLAPESIAVNPVTNKIYAANGGSNNVTVIDGATNSVTILPAGERPIAVAANPVTNRIYVVNGGDANGQPNTVTVIDGATNSTTSVAVSANPVAVAVNSVTNQIYVATNENVTVIDGATNGTTVIPIVDTNPNTLAVNPVTNKIYVANADNVTVIDGPTNNTTTIAAGSALDSIAVNPVTNKIYVANLDSNLVTVIDGATNGMTTVQVGQGPRSMAVNPLTNKIYVANQGSGDVTVIDGATNGTLTVAAGANPVSVAVNSVTNQIYVATNENVTVIDGPTNSTVRVAAGTGPSQAAINRATNKIYVANSDSGTVTVIDGATNTAATVSVGPQSEPVALAVNPVTNRIYVANSNTDNVTVIAEQQVQPLPLTTAITPLAGNQTTDPTPKFTFTANSTTVSNPSGVFFQVDTWQGPWSTATGSDPNFSGTLAPLPAGLHILYAFAADSQVANSTQAQTLLTGTIQAYEFVVLPPPPSIQITVGASAAGLSFSVDGTSYTSSQTFDWSVGSSHTLSTTSPQIGPGGTQYAFSSWSDGTTSLSDTIATPNSAARFTAAFRALKAQTITFAYPGAQLVGTPLTLVATASSGLPVSFAGRGTCTVTNGVATFPSTGVCSVVASQSGNSVYASAPHVTQTFIANSEVLKYRSVWSSWYPAKTSAAGRPLIIADAPAPPETATIVSPSNQRFNAKFRSHPVFRRQHPLVRRQTKGPSRKQDRKRDRMNLGTEAGIANPSGPISSHRF